MTPFEFIKSFGDAIVQGTTGFSIFPSVKAAQMALETGWGASIKGNNAFGIKAAGSTSPYWKGNSQNMATHEVIAGQSVAINDKFRAYPSIGDSIADHSYFLMQNKRYSAVFTAKTPEEQCQALQKAGYSTDPDYAKKLIQIINKYNLKELDKKKRS